MELLNYDKYGVASQITCIKPTSIYFKHQTDLMYLNHKDFFTKIGFFTTTIWDFPGTILMSDVFSSWLEIEDEHQGNKLGIRLFCTALKGLNEAFPRLDKFMFTLDSTAILLMIELADLDPNLLNSLEITKRTPSKEIIRPEEEPKFGSKSIIDLITILQKIRTYEAREEWDPKRRAVVQANMLEPDQVGYSFFRATINLSTFNPPEELILVSLS